MTEQRMRDCLVQELGLVRGMRVWFHGMPAELHAAIDPDAIGVEEQNAPSDGLQFAMLFVASEEKLARQLAAARPLMQPKAAVWVAWPEAGSGIETDLDADRVRALVHAHALIEIKSFQLDPDWRSLKFRVQRQ